MSEQSLKCLFRSEKSINPRIEWGEDLCFAFHFLNARKNKKGSQFHVRMGRGTSYFVLLLLLFTFELHGKLNGPLLVRRQKCQRPQILSAPSNRPFSSQHPLQRRECPQEGAGAHFGNHCFRRWLWRLSAFEIVFYTSLFYDYILSTMMKKVWEPLFYWHYSKHFLE